MILSIQNDCLHVCVDTLGAQLRSIRGLSGTEYLWQGDPAIWKDQAPVLFPVIGRLEGKQYALNGQVYDMGIHGFAKLSEFSVISHADSALTLALQESQETLAAYPFAFTFEITYRLEGSTLAIENRIHNRSEGVMPFALGGHPGFRVPWGDGSFEDYYLEFSQRCQPDRIGFTSDSILVNGQTQRYPLQDDRLLSLHHNLFDGDAIILQNIDRVISLKSPNGGAITVAYPDMPYLGIWHMPKMAAPYVCIEPWSSLPGRCHVTEAIGCRSDFVQLSPGQLYQNTWTITVKED